MSDDLNLNDLYTNNIDIMCRIFTTALTPDSFEDMVVYQDIDTDFMYVVPAEDFLNKFTKMEFDNVG